MSSQSSQHSAGQLSNRNAQEETANGTHLQPFTVRPSIPATFTTKLYAMIEDERQSLITWSPSGDRFRVHNVSEFSSSILPQYFKHSNWPSFVRQLNMYGFRKVSSGLQDVDDASSSDLSRQIWEFKHDDFRKGGQNRLHLIRRKSTRAPRSPFQYRFTNSMETLQDTADVEGQAKSLQSMENQKHNQLRESEQAVHNLQLQAQQLCHEMQKLKSLAARQQAILSQTIDVLADILQNTTKGHPLNREEASLDHLKRTLCELLPDDRQLPNVPVTGAIIEERGFQLKIPARESDQEFCLPYDPVFDKTDYRRNTSDESGSNEWTRSIKRKENGSSMNPYAGSLGTDPDIESNVQHAMRGSPG